MSEGSLTITTDPSPLAISIYDSALNIVAQAVSPAATLRLAPGIYLVQASRPSQPDLTALATVVADSVRTLHLTGQEPNVLQRLTANAFTGFERVVRKIQTPELMAAQAPAPQKPAKKPELIWARFLWLYDWDTAQVIPPPGMKWRSASHEIVLELSSSRRHVTFLQVTNGKGPPLNVALPPGGLARPALCEVAISESRSGLSARLQLSTAWANSALQYMAQGVLDQAQRVIDEAARHEPSGRFSWLHRFEDPAAALVERYLRFRTGAESVGETAKNLVLDPLQKLADGLILSAETFARQGNNRLACQQLMRIPAGALPLYTEGFALLMDRLRELLDVEKNQDEASVARLRELRKTLAKWAPYVDCASPTLTFPGEDLALPRLASGKENLLESTGWIPIRETSIIESVRSAVKISSPAPPVSVPETESTASVSAEILARIDHFTAHCIRRYRRTKYLHYLTSCAALLLSVAIVAAGVYDAPRIVTALGAGIAVIFAAGRVLNFEQRVLNYRMLISEARILSTEAKNSRISASQTARRLNLLVLGEATAVFPTSEQ